MLPRKYRKKSFLKFSCSVDTNKLLEEYRSIPDSAWGSSYWGNIHCSVGMLLLRGGKQGTEHDFFSELVHDKPILDELPYIKHLISEEGPFGKAGYAFIFRLEPNGVSLKHRDMIKKWENMYRIHVPIITNDGAFLIANEKSQHFSLGSAWSFDNQSDHGVVNGDQERVHLIFDVEFNPKLARAIDSAKFIEGKRIKKHIITISKENKARASYPGDQVMKNAILDLRQRGANESQIADFFNAKNIPSKSYPAKPWDKEMILSLLN